jgi:hypothetical protein
MCSRKIKGLSRFQLSPRFDWWSQTGSNRRPLQCHCRGQRISVAGGITFGCDVDGNPSIPTPWRKAETRNADPMQATNMARLINPVTGEAELIFDADKFTFMDKSGNHCSFKCVGTTFIPC